MRYRYDAFDGFDLPDHGILRPGERTPYDQDYAAKCVSSAPASWYAVYIHRPAGLVGEPMHLAQSKTGALPNRFRREKRLKGIRFDVRRHALAVISDLQHQEVAVEAKRRVADLLIESLNSEMSPVRHRVARIEGKV
jgi:hypothetical protein